MAELHDVMAYLVKKYPGNLQHELSNARLTKMIYLADWHQAINRGRQITDISWYSDNFGPFVRDIEKTAAERDDLFVVNLGSNIHGQAKKSFALRDANYNPRLKPEEVESLDHIINVASKLYWAPFINLVYSTHPIASSQRYSYLDLLTKAKEYKAGQVQQAKGLS